MTVFALTPLSSMREDQLQRLFKNFRDLEDLLDHRLGADNIALLAITAALIADGTITPAKIVGSPQSVGSTYTGDGTANRIINLGFTPKHVIVARQSNGTIFDALSDGTTALTNWWRVAAGTQSSGAADWQGIVANGFKCGSNAGATSNVNTETYFYVAYR